MGTTCTLYLLRKESRMSYLRLQRVRHFGASPMVRNCLLLLATSALGSCGGLTDPTRSPDFVFAGTQTRIGNVTFHHFTAPRGGTLAASVEWANPHTQQTVCAGRSDRPDEPSTCAPSVAGRSNTVTVSVMAGDPYTVYGATDFSADAAYTIEVRIR